MSDLDTEAFNDTDSSDNEEQYSKLVSSVSQLDSTQRVKPASRKEISSEISEYNLQKGNLKNNLVHVNDLAQVLKKKPKHTSITHKLKKVTRKSKTLPKPLEKSAEDKLKRIIGYESIKRQIKRWNAVVTRNSLKDHITFPLNDNTLKLENRSTFLNQFQTPTPLEMEMAKVLNQDQQPNKENEIDSFPLTLEEMLEKRKEMAHLRAQLSYKQAKAQRQNKIKSKKYHQILKREKLRQQLKEFEILQKTDPTKALEKLAELDKNRALERASLRHRNTGHWAKNLTVRAKYDVESRKILAEQLKMSREITQKTQMANSSDEETENTAGQNNSSDTAKSLVVTKDNPWSLDVSKEFEEFISGYKKFWSEKNDESKKTDIHEKTNEESSKQTEERQELKENAVPVQEENNEQNSESNSNSVQSNGKLVLDKKNNQLPKKKKKAVKSKTPLKQQKNLSECTTILKPTPLNKETSIVTVRPTSGVWIITTVSEEQEAVEQPVPKKKIRQSENIENLFCDLEDKLMKKANQKAKKIKSKLKKQEKLDKKKQLKVKKSKSKNFDLPLKSFNKVQRADMDVGLLEGGVEENEIPEANNKNGSEPGKNISNNNDPFNDKTMTAEIDPKNFMKVKPKKLGTDFSGHTNMEEDAIDDEIELQQNKIIEEAFGEDDVIAELNEIKKEDDKKEIISNCLPGWGEWGGTGLKPSKRKKKLFTIMHKTERKDKKKTDMVINEKANPNIRNHLVTKIPHPFKSKEAFESIIRAPIGREWIPETAHRNLIQPAVETKLGTIIDPMNEDEIAKLKKQPKSPYLGKRKEQKNS